MPKLSRRELGDLVAEHMDGKLDGLMLAAISAFISNAPDEVIALIGQQMDVLVQAVESEGVEGARRVLEEMEVPPEIQEVVLAHVPRRPDD